MLLLCPTLRNTRYYTKNTKTTFIFLVPRHFYDKMIIFERFFSTFKRLGYGFGENTISGFLIVSKSLYSTEDASRNHKILSIIHLEHIHMKIFSFTSPNNYFLGLFIIKLYFSSF